MITNRRGGGTPRWHLARWGGAATLLLAVVAADAVAQSPRSRPRAANPAEVKRLDAKLGEVQSAFIRETTSLITSYESLGQFDRVKSILEAFAKLDPANEKIKAKLAELDQRILESGEFEIEIEPGEAWQPVGAVVKDRPLRIRVSGDYRFQSAGTTTADGIAGNDPQTDLVTGVPFGAVMGIIVPSGTNGQGGRDAKQQPRPFLVGSLYEKAAERDGVLYLRANVPVGTKCVGRLDALVSGPQQ